jgi:hypothetical protein
MAYRTLSSTCFSLAAFAALTAASASAQQVSVNPFLPPSNVAAGAPTAGAPIEFRGYMEDSGGVRFRLYDPARKTGSWVKLNERDSTLDVVAKQFNGGENETLVVEMQGRTFTLAQRTAKVASSGSAVANIPLPSIPIAPGANVPPAVTQAVVVNPTPADEAKRLEAVASEVARRRALREQAANGNAQPQQAQPPPPMPAQPQGQPNNNQQRPQRR